MRARVCAHLCTGLAIAAAIALVNRWFMMAAGFTLVAILPLYLGGD